MRVFVLPLLTMAVLSACATSHVSDAEATPARAVLDVALTRADPSRGMLTIKRDTGFEGGGCDHRMLLDGVAVADLRPGEVVTIYAPAGEHTLTMQVRGLICPALESALTVQADPARPHRFTTGSANLQTRLIPAP